MRLASLFLGVGILTSPGGALASEWRPGPYVVTPEHQLDTRKNDGTLSKIIYVNDCKPDGCFIRAGDINDAHENISTVPDRDSTLSPFGHEQEVWDSTIACLRQVFGPYDVQIVTEDPGDALHHEAILAGSPDEMELPEDVGGVAPFACQPINNAISFSFANQIGPDWIDLCWTVAQESAHAYGLDHAFECLDPMTYLFGCGQKFFRNDNLPCGEYTERACACTGNTQNAHQMLLNVFGPGTPPPPPTLSIEYPADGGTVPRGFLVSARATDPRLIARIELYINGWLYDNRSGHAYRSRNDPYRFTLPALPDGIMDIDVIAYNDLDVAATERVTVTQGAPCMSADTCLDGQYCSEGRCTWPPPTGELGDACERGTDCISRLCPQNGEVRLCSQYCLLQAEDQCPGGFECLPAGSSGVCWPVASSGCCSAGADRGLTAGQLALFLAVTALLWRRRAERPAVRRAAG